MNQLNEFEHNEMLQLEMQCHQLGLTNSHLKRIFKNTSCIYRYIAYIRNIVTCDKPLLRVAFREVKHGKFKGEIDAVFLDDNMLQRNYRLQCYSKRGQHSSGDASYFYHSTKPAKNYTDLLAELCMIYSDYKIFQVAKLPKYETIINKLRKVNQGA